MPQGLNGRLEQWWKALEDKGLRVSIGKTQYVRCNFNMSESDMNKEEEIRIYKHILKPNESFRYLGSVMHKSGRIEDDVTHSIQVGWVAIRPAMMYGSECWPLTKVQVNRMEVAEMRMLRVDLWRVESLTVDEMRRRGRPKLRWEDKLKTDLNEMLLSEDITFDRNAWRTRIRVDEGISCLRASLPVCDFCICLHVWSVVSLLALLLIYAPVFVALACGMLVMLCLFPEVFLEAVPLPSGRGVTIYITPPPYLVPAGLRYVVVVVILRQDGKECKLTIHTPTHHSNTMPVF
nr:hypothetical protein [Tanacetum cinerariifolium]